MRSCAAPAPPSRCRSRRTRSPSRRASPQVAGHLGAPVLLTGGRGAPLGRPAKPDRPHPPLAAESPRVGGEVDPASPGGRGGRLAPLSKAQGPPSGPPLGELLFSKEYACVYCGISMEEPAPRNFSFNSPHGACTACTGLGMRMEVDPEAVVPDPSLSINEGALSGWTRGPSMSWLMDVLETVARKFKVSPSTPWKNLTAKEQRLILYGLPKDETVRIRYVSHSGYSRSYDAGFEGVVNNLERRYRETESDWVKQEIERLMMQKPCPACDGGRLKPEYLAVTVDGMNIMELCRHSVIAALGRIDRLTLSERENIIARQVLKDIRERLGFLHDVGLDYLTLDRGAATLSGGEAQRIRLATQIGSRLMGVLYILDEPSIGLHQRDNHK